VPCFAAKHSGEGRVLVQKWQHRHASTQDFVGACMGSVQIPRQKRRKSWSILLRVRAFVMPVPSMVREHEDWGLNLRR
jgi:hypothetical protein